MEYQFQSGPNQKPLTARLNEFELSLEADGVAKRIPYASITEVRLNKKSDAYSIQIFALDFGTIVLSNKSYQGGTWTNQYRTYQTFVRVLHLHLSNKSKAIFYSGSNLTEYTRKGIVLFVVAACLFLGEEYFNLLPMSSSLLSLIFFVAGALIILIPALNRWPKSYSPAEIPLDLLPPA